MGQRIAEQIVESLRKGVPPQHGVNCYSVGNEKLIDGINKFHFKNIDSQGKIRFISGSWGAGKTHFFRQLREASYNQNCLVSNVELDVSSAALNKFQTVFAAIIRQISTQSSYDSDTEIQAAPFGLVLRESLAWLADKSRELSEEMPYDKFENAVNFNPNS